MKWKELVVLYLLAFFCLSANPTHSPVNTSGLVPKQYAGPPLVNKTVLLNNDSGMIPLRNLDQRKIAVLLPLDGGMEEFAGQLGRYADLDTYYWNRSALEGPALDESIKFYNTLLFAIPDDWVQEQLLMEFIGSQSTGKEIAVLVTGLGDGLRFLDWADFPILWTPEGGKQSLHYAAMSVFGGLGCAGRLEASYSEKYQQGAGSSTTQVRLCYAGGDHTTINSQMLTHAIDGIMAEAIQANATPGGVVMVVQDGNVLFEKAYGHHTYSGRRRTGISDIFDLASITKIVATTPAVMRLVDEGDIDLDQTMGHYLWQAAGTDKARTRLRDVMLHEGGFIPYIPFYRDLEPGDLRSDSSAAYAVKVTDGRFIRTGYYEQVMWPRMLGSELRTPGQYVYSDVSMYVMKEIIEHQTGIAIQNYVQRTFYRPLGMSNAGYNPRLRFPKERIVPTEDDGYFRRTLLHGYVHDQGAAMAGGIAGHAGLFATANDLAIYGQLLLNRGEYGGERYFKPETVDFFTSKQSGSSRRGLGFDRRDIEPGSLYPSGMASDATFGHTGYTGTAMWIDPEKRLVFIFLSNRVHPQVSRKLNKLAIRRRVLDIVYVALR